MSELGDLRKEIKAWEHSFQKKHGRVPLREDIKQNNVISSLYKQYRDLKKGPAKALKLPKKTRIDVQIEDSDEDGSGTDMENATSVAVGIQLGPTPQANGKILSLFDTRMTPPESSPLKSKQTLQVKEEISDDKIFKTPTKKRIVDINAQLQAAAHQTSLSIIKSSPNVLPVPSPVRQTPRYMSRNMFMATEYGPVTPSKPTQGFEVSPSPLKPQRLFNYGTKRLADIFNEVQSIKENIVVPEDSNDPVSDEEVDGEKPSEGPKPKKAKTQKRTTRRWKIKPRPEAENETSLEKKDIHEAIQNIDEKRQRNHERYLNSEDEESYSEPEKIAPQALGKKIKPLSMNYQRLKINDPRAKAFKRRMRR